MTTATNTTREVTAVSRKGVTVSGSGKTTVLPWGTLRAAAVQTDAELRAVYAPLLKQALAAAAALREVTVSIVNDTHTPHGYEARLHDVAGEFVSGRIVAADFGQRGSLAEAKMDMERAVERLNKSHVVHTGSIARM